VGPHESMTCEIHGIYLKFGSFNGIDPIVLFFFEREEHKRSTNDTSSTDQGQGPSVVSVPLPQSGSSSLLPTCLHNSP
jgi:hypothetical protein